MNATAIREGPILMSGPMVRAILDKRKTQTRRIVVAPRWAMACEPADACRVDCEFERPSNPSAPAWPWVYQPVSGWWKMECPYGQPGDRLWVRETHLRMATEIGSKVGNPEFDEIMYVDALDYDLCVPTKDQKIDLGWRVKPSIFMPRWASRLTLEITEVRVERLQDISEEDARAEGTESVVGFAFAWDSLNAKRGYGWNVNPWVWCIAFEIVTP